MPTLATPLNNVSGLALASAHAANASTLVLLLGQGDTVRAALTEAGATISAGAPVRVTVSKAAAVNAYGQITDRSKVCVFLATGLTGDTFTGCTAADGMTDIGFGAGDRVGLYLTAGHIADIHATLAAKANTGDAIQSSQLPGSGVSPGTYRIPSVTVDAKGRVTAASAASIAGSDLPTSGVSAGGYGVGSTVTFDATGRATSAATDSNFTWDGTAKTHTVKGQALVTTTISSVSVSGGIPTVTVNSTAGFVVGQYAVIAGLTANSWLNGTSRVNQVLNSTQYQPGVAPHADQGSVADSGTATVNPQTGNLGRFQTGDGTDITTIGPFGTLVIAPPSYSDQPCIELRPPASAAGTVPSLRWQSPYDPVGKFSTYFNEAGDFYNLLIGVFSGHYQGSGPGFNIIPPTTPMPTVLEVNVQAWADDDGALAVRGADASQGVGHTCQVIGIDDVTNSFCWGVTSPGKFVFGSTQSVDANRMPLWDCGGPYRVSAGVIGFDGSVQIGDPSSPTLTLKKGASSGQIYNDGSMTLLGDSSSHAIVYRANNHNFFNYATSAFFLEIDAGGVHVGNVSGSGTANAQLESTPNSAGKPGLAIYTSAGVETLKVLSGAVIVGQGTGITKVLSATATLDFPSTAAQTSSELTITVTGAAVGDTVAIGLPAAPPANCNFSGYVSATDTVTIRLNNYSSGAIDPASGTYRATVIKF